MLRIVFMGTPEFALPSLQRLVSEGYLVCAVVTQTDKPKGRGNKITMTPIKEFALNKCITVLQPENLRDSLFVEELKNLKPDSFVTAAYGKILPKEVLDIPQYGCINVHASLLPRLRGAGPIQWSIINGDKVTGITTMLTDVGLDTGDMLLKEEVSIDCCMTATELHDKLSHVGADVLARTINGLIDKTITRTPQDNSKATYAPMINKEHDHINWNKTALEIHNLVRGVNPWPGAFTTYKKQRMRVCRACIDERMCFNSQPGTIIGVDRDGIVVATKDYAIRIVDVQFDSCRRMCVGDYLCGNKIDEGEILGKED